MYQVKMPSVIKVKKCDKLFHGVFTPINFITINAENCNKNNRTIVLKVLTTIFLSSITINVSNHVS
jgi:hypothetical protein